MALRYFNAAGADPDGSLGEMHHPETHLIPRVIEAAITPGSRVEVFGTDHPTPDGTAIRDYIHVADLARAHVLAIDHLRSGGESQALNLGTGTGSSVREVVRTVERVSGRRIHELPMPRRAGDPPALVAHACQAAAILRWQPRMSRIEDIVATAWRWHTGKGNHNVTSDMAEGSCVDMRDDLVDIGDR
jgi:UDP-glucose 4-epimerase